MEGNFSSEYVVSRYMREIWQACKVLARFTAKGKFIFGHRTLDDIKVCSAGMQGLKYCNQ